MKSKEELKAIKEEVENLNKKLDELTDEELAKVNAGISATCPTISDKNGEQKADLNSIMDS